MFDVRCSMFSQRSFALDVTCSMSAGPDNSADPISKPMPWWLRPLFEAHSRRRIASFLGSLIAHAAALLALATLFQHAHERPARAVLTMSPADSRDELDSTEPLTPAVKVSSAAPNLANDPTTDVEIPNLDNILPPAVGKPVAVAPEPMPRPQEPPKSSSDLLTALGVPSGGGYEGRSKPARARLVGEQGGTKESEDAVEMGLAWLAAHQRVDGGWRFDLRDGPCGGRCGNSGSHGTTTGATALALLPFLGAGYLPTDPKYGPVVERGLYYLKNRVLMTPHGGDLQEGSMYGHGLATITLCEAYSLTQDDTLRPVAQSAIDFICHVQHPKGGWRYYPGQPGDTTVFGWQFMSLKSGQMAGLTVPSPIIERAKEYLNSVQTGDGAYYGYLKADKEPTPSAVGLLSRMYCGWPRNDARLQKGLDYLSKLGPSKHDMYFNYYATQVLHHYNGSLWSEWNRKLRDYLISTQSRMAHETGSWHFTDQHGTAGGRLYTTAMCVMILEVYYRHMPLYGEKTLQGF